MPPIRNKVDILKKLNDEKKNEAKIKLENSSQNFNLSEDPKNDDK